MISSADWEALKEDVLRRCQEHRSGEAVADLRAVSGIDWCDPGAPGQVPPTPARRSIEGTLRSMPRRLRRHARRTLGSEDACGAHEVIGCLYDAELETSVTGEDRRAIYLEYLHEVSYGASVLRFIRAAYLWVTGDDDEADWVARWIALLAFLSSASEVPSEAAGRRHHDVLVPRASPIEARPQMAQNGPPFRPGNGSPDGDAAVGFPGPRKN